jgi:hypothetical protein
MNGCGAVLSEEKHKKRNRLGKDRDNFSVLNMLK